MKISTKKIRRKIKKGVGKMSRDFKASKIARAARSPAHLTSPKKGRGLF